MDGSYKLTANVGKALERKLLQRRQWNGRSVCRFISCSRWLLVLVWIREKISSVARKILRGWEIAGRVKVELPSPQTGPNSTEKQLLQVDISWIQIWIIFILQ